MKRLFGVTRDDLREMAKGRVGNEEPNLRLAKRPSGSLAAQNIQTPQNTQRIDSYLQELPGKINEITRTATTGSWFNFYLCDFNGQILIPAGKTINFKSYQGRCG